MKITAHLVDLHARRIFPAEAHFENGKISQISEIENPLAPGETGFLLPGFVDAHVHIESSMLPPSEFARLALPVIPALKMTDLGLFDAEKFEFCEVGLL